MAWSRASLAEPALPGGTGRAGPETPHPVATCWFAANSPLILALLLQPRFGNGARESLTKKILSFALQHLISPLTVHL